MLLFPCIKRCSKQLICFEVNFNCKHSANFVPALPVRDLQATIKGSHIGNVENTQSQAYNSNSSTANSSKIFQSKSIQQNNGAPVADPHIERQRLCALCVGA